MFTWIHHFTSLTPSSTTRFFPLVLLSDFRFSFNYLFWILLLDGGTVRLAFSSCVCMRHLVYHLRRFIVKNNINNKNRIQHCLCTSSSIDCDCLTLHSGYKFPDGNCRLKALHCIALNGLDLT